MGKRTQNLRLVNLAFTLRLILEGINEQSIGAKVKKTWKETANRDLQIIYHVRLITFPPCQSSTSVVEAVVGTIWSCLQWGFSVVSCLVSSQEEDGVEEISKTWIDHYKHTHAQCALFCVPIRLNIQIMRSLPLMSQLISATLGKDSQQHKKLPCISYFTRTALCSPFPIGKHETAGSASIKEW